MSSNSPKNNFWLHAESAICKYSERFASMSNVELSAIVERERNLRAWGSERSYYLHALREECARRGIPYSLMNQESHSGKNSDC